MGGCWVAIGAAVLACSAEEPPAPEAPPIPTASTEVRDDAPDAPPFAVAPGNPTEESSASASSEAPPSLDPENSAPPALALADLLRLPGGISPADAAAARVTRDPESAIPGAMPKKPSRLGVQFDSRSDPAAVHPAKTRTQTNAEVHVDVTESTRLRGGVRVQEESDTEPAARVPTIGIEKRF